MASMANTAQYESAVIGGGPAGLQAALTMSRVGIRVALIDAGAGRNARTSHIHNVVTRDGTPPEEFRRIAREELTRYGVDLIDDSVARAIAEQGDGTHFTLELGSGTQVATERIVLATGIRDDLDALPAGLARHWGGAVFHCPFCHGRESGQTVVVAGDLPHLSGPAQMLARLGRDVTWLTDQLVPEPALVERLRADGIAWQQGTVTEAIETDGQLTALRLADGSEVACDSVLTHAPTLVNDDLARQLGVAFGDAMPLEGVMLADAFGHTSVPGVWAVGEAAGDPATGMRPMSVVDVMSGGQRAAAAIVRSVLA